MALVYTAYEAKAKFSELLRYVQAGRRVRVTLRGQTVAEVCPIRHEEISFADHLDGLERERIVAPAQMPFSQAFAPLKYVPGALQQFLDERE